MDVTASAPLLAARQGMARIVWSSIIGTAVEWYDFMIYGTATALVFNRLFFPAADPAIADIVAYGTYGVGFFARPLGAAIFGHFGDRIGRKAMLAATISITGVGTFLIGLLPTYDQLGVLAPVLLVVLRLLQGIGLGGEWGGAVLMVVESAPVRHRGLLGSMVQIGNPLGNLTAIAAFNVLATLPNEAFFSWGWRIPFLISVVMVAIGLWIRLSLQETPVFRGMVAQAGVARIPIAEVFGANLRPFLIAVGIKINEIAWASIAGVFVLTYATGVLGLPRTMLLNDLLIANVIALAAIPLFGHLSDRFGRKAMCYASCTFGIVFAFPLFSLLGTKEPLAVAAAIVAGITFGQMMMFGIGAPWYSELFPARLRYSGASLGFQIGAAISGGLSPVIAAALIKWSGGATWPISLYLVLCAFVTLTAALAAPETARQELRSQ